MTGYDFTDPKDRQEYVFRELEPLRVKCDRLVIAFLFSFIVGILPIVYVYITKQAVSWLWVFWTSAFFSLCALCAARYRRHQFTISLRYSVLRPKN